MSLGKVEAYLYSSGTAGVFSATQSLTIAETAGLTATVTLPAPALFTQALVDWQAAINAAGFANTYIVEWDVGRQSVVLVRDTGVATFLPTLIGALHLAWGWVVPAPTPAGTAFSGDTQGRARFDSVRVGAAPVRPGSRDDFTTYRHGRAESLAFGNHNLHEITVTLPKAQGAVFAESYCTTGRIRVSQDQTVATPWAYDAPSGYLDGYVLAVSALDTLSQSEQWTRTRLLLAVP